MSSSPQATSATPWLPVMALASSQLVAWGILYYAFAVIQEPMGAELGWSKPQMNGALSLGLCISGLAAYSVGSWIDRHGGRGVMVLGALLGAGGVFVWSQVTALWQLYMAWALIGIAASMSLYEAAFAVAARLVPGNYRQSITAITVLGGLASTAFIPLTFWLEESLGWRASLVVLAALMLLACVTIPLVVLPRTGRDGAQRSRRGSLPTTSIFHQVKHQPIFWLLVTSYVTHAFFYTSLLFSLLPLLQSQGIDPSAAVGLYAMIGPAQVVGRLCLLTIDRRLTTALAGIIATLLPVTAMLALIAIEPGSLVAMAFPVLFGAGMGIKTVVQATAAPEFLRQRSYGALQGLIALPVALSQAAAPFLSALLWQVTGETAVLMGTLLALAVVSAATFGFAVRIAAIKPATPASSPT